MNQKFNNITIFILGVASSTALYWLSFSPYGLGPKLMAIFSSLVIFLLFWEVLLNRNLRTIYILPFITLNWLYFQSPFLLKDKTYYYNRIISEEYIDEISIYCCFSIYMIFIGYKFFLNGNYKPISSVKLQFKKEVLVKVVYFFMLLGFIFRLGQQVTPVLMANLSNLIQLLPYCSTIAFGFYLLIYLKGYKAKRISFFDVVVVLFLIGDFLIRLSTTLSSEVVILFYGPILIYFREKSKLPIISIGLSLIVLIPLYQTRKYFRLESDEIKEFKGGQISKGKLLLESAYSVSDQKDYQKLKERSEDFNRFENLSFISHVVLQHKKRIKPFLYGETFYWLPLVPIPRILYPSKPRNVMSRDVATAYGLRGKDSIASINFPMLVEGYINFDFKGMLVMAFIFGLAYKWFAMKFGFGLGDVNLIIIINSIKQFTHAEGNITLVFGALIQVFLFWSVIIWFFKLNEKNTKLFNVE